MRARSRCRDKAIVIDTNVFVAAGFNSKSAAARVFEGVREGRFRLIWNEPTRRETEIIVRRIPRLDWASIADLFQPEAEFAGPVDLEAFTAISDPDDRNSQR
jgi:predicted nucleic acid-binding protein